MRQIGVHLATAITLSALCLSVPCQSVADRPAAELPVIDLRFDRFERIAGELRIERGGVILRPVSPEEVSTGRVQRYRAEFYAEEPSDIDSVTMAETIISLAAVSSSEILRQFAESDVDRLAQAIRRSQGPSAEIRCLSPDGKCVFRTYAIPAQIPQSADPGLWATFSDATALFNLESSESHLLAPTHAEPHIAVMGTPRWSPDGRYLAYHTTPATSIFREAAMPIGVTSPMHLEDRRGWDLRVWDAHSGEVSTVCERGYWTSLIFGLEPNAWSPDSTKILFITSLDDMWADPERGRVQSLHMADLSDGTVRRLIEEGLSAKAYVWAPDSRHALTQTAGPLIWDPGRERFIFPSESDLNIEYRLIDTQTGEHRVVWRTSETPEIDQTIVQFSISPDLRWAAADIRPISGEAPARGDLHLYLMDLESDEGPRLVYHLAAQGQGRFSQAQIIWAEMTERPVAEVD